MRRLVAMAALAASLAACGHVESHAERRERILAEYQRENAEDIALAQQTALAEPAK